MRVLIINKFLYPNGGSETYIFKLGEALEQHGHEVQYFGMEHEGRCVGNRVNAYTSGMDFHGGSKLSKLTYPIKTIYSKEARVQLRKVLDDFKPDVCHLNNFNYQLTPSIILEIVKWRKETGRDCKIIFTAHDYQLVCPNHQLKNPITHENCEKCLGGHFMNTHEAIISAEQFELVQRILETETRRPNDAETVALFAGFLYCGDCGSRLVRRSASYKGKRYIYYQCSGSKQNKGSCTSHNLRDEKLYNVVRNALQMQIQIVMEEAEFVESIRQAQQEPYRVRRIERQIRQLTAEKAHTQGIKEKLYGDYADEILTREDFLNYNELYSKRIEEYNRKITELEAERQNLQTAPNAYPFLDVYRKYRKLEEITRPMVVELIEKIEVYEGNRVEITFRFQDEIADLLEELHQKQMGQREVSA